MYNYPASTPQIDLREALEIIAAVGTIVSLFAFFFGGESKTILTFSIVAGAAGVVSKMLPQQCPPGCIPVTHQLAMPYEIPPSFETD